MPKIHLQVSSSSTIGSHLICWRDWSDYSHVDVVLPNGKLFGARGDGVMARDPYKISKKLDLYVDVSKSEEELFYFALLSQDGKHYDFAGIFGFVSNRDWQELDKWFCSELVLWAFLRAGVRLLRTSDVHRISVGMLILSPVLYEE